MIAQSSELGRTPLFLRARREYDRLVEEVGKSDALTVINYQRFIARHNLSGRDDKPWVAEDTRLKLVELKNAEVSE